MEKLLLSRVKHALMALIILACGCSTVADQTSEQKSAMTLCTDPRPEICTMIYDPVCGQLNDGSWKTYSSDCSACSDAEVKGWKPGECEN